MSATAQRKFAFGENWSRYAANAGEEHIAQAAADLERLTGSLQGKSFLDIGCGSGIHALAAVRLAASSVHAFDADQKSAETARTFLSAHAPGVQAVIAVADILTRPADPRYDVVYSWGVLHHTGDMWTAIANAAGFVAPQGKLVLAIYKKTPCCGFWRAEKSFYARLPSLLQVPVTALFSGFFLLGLTLSGRNPVAYVRNYKSLRGMNFWRDMIDWLGGYPYESATPDEVKDFMRARGFRTVAEYNTGPVRAGGLFGSGCAEFVFERETGR